MVDNDLVRKNRTCKVPEVKVSLRLCHCSVKSRKAIHDREGIKDPADGKLLEDFE